MMNYPNDEQKGANPSYWNYLPPYQVPLTYAPVSYLPYPYTDAYSNQQLPLQSDRQVTMQQIQERLLDALTGEYNAIICYEKLVLMAPNEEAAHIIKEIRKDEQKHYQQFAAQYKNLFGQEAQVKQTETCADTFHEGIRAAFFDEQNTVDQYMENADMLRQYPAISRVFNRAARDEQQHAVWFLYFLNHRQFG